MNFELSEEQEAAQDLSRQILADASSFDRLREVERDENGPGFDRELWGQLAESNLIGLALPEEYGGQGFDFFSLCLVLEQAGKNLTPVPLMETIVYTALPIENFGSEMLKKDVLNKVVSGDLILTPAFFEVGDPALSRKAKTNATPSGGGFELNGEKTCVPFAGAADRLLVTASGPEGLGLFLVDPKADGVELAVQKTTAHERQYLVTFKNVAVESGDVLAAPGAGEAVLDWLEPRAAVALSALSVGVCDEALRQTAVYTSERKQFGKEIGSFQGVSLRAADAYIDVQSMRSTMWEAAWRLDNGHSGEKEAAIAKWWACRGGHRVTHTAQHLHGGIGADIDYPVHRFFLRLKHLAFTLGGANEQLAKLGAQIAEQAKSGVAAEEILT